MFLIVKCISVVLNKWLHLSSFPLIFVLPGYRHIHLLSKDGTRIPPASLFVHIRITDLE